MGDASQRQLPPYVSDRGHGEQSYAGPLAITDVTSYGFPLKADGAALQRFVDGQLNGVSDGAYQYKALPFVIHAWVHVGRAYSETEVVGWMPDHESMFFVPLLQRKRGELLPKLVFWIPYLFIDVVAGLVTAREVYGFRKMPATLQFPAQLGDPAHFTADTLMFKTFAPDTRGQHGRILETTGSENLTPTAEPWKDAEHAFRDLLIQVAGKLGVDGGIIAEETLQPFLGDFRFPMLNLKQFRDAAHNDRACYQALVSTPGALKSWTGGGVLKGDFETVVTTCANYQIVEDLGLASKVGEESTTIKPLFGFWITMSFVLENGDVLWQAPNT